MDKPYDMKSDIWSLGAVLYEMAVLLPPFRASNMAALATKVTRGVYEKLPNNFSSDLSQMIRSCLQVTPSKRPTADKILVTPGLMKRMTDTLKEDTFEESDDKDKLLKTIRCPMNLG